jgi:8-oxo-dGTP pyrophosphatase MutT (NUDIX family)
VNSRRSQLAQLLDALVPADEAEQAHKARMQTLLGSPGDVFAREHYVPGHFTASAFIVSPARDAILLILHGKLGLWLQPGGHVDASDTDVIVAARREVEEEVSLSQLPLAHPGIFDVDVHVIPARKEAPAHEHFDVRFVFEAEASSGRAGSDAKDARWVSLDEVSKLQTDESVMRAVRKLRGAR